MQRLLAKALLLSLLLLPAAAQDGSDSVRPWVVRATVRDGWGLHENFWVTSNSQVGFADLGLGMRMPCAGPANSESVSSIEESLMVAVRDGHKSRRNNSQCNDEPRIEVLILYARTDQGSRILEAEFSELETCRRFPISTGLDQTIAQVLEVGRALRDFCEMRKETP